MLKMTAHEKNQRILRIFSVCVAENGDILSLRVFATQKLPWKFPLCAASVRRFFGSLGTEKNTQGERIMRNLWQTAETAKSEL